MRIADLRAITARGGWGALVRAEGHEALDLLAGADFGIYWIEAGHRIREQVADDKLLAACLRRLLPTYSGTRVTLYRGENVARWRAGHLGFAWTAHEEIAQMFAAGLNAVYSGGVLLQCTFEPAAIICGPNAHSSYLQEEQYTVEPACAERVQLIATYPAN